MTARQRPEALAQFADTARKADGKQRPGLVADQGTAPIPTDSKAKDEAATKVLQEGATGQDHGAEEAIDRLPDRILESRRADNAKDPSDEPDPAGSEVSYDATTDPRTGRPPLPNEAERLNRERELQQLRNAQLSEGEDDLAEGETDEDEIDVTLENEDDAFVNSMIDEQAPGRMVSPADDADDEEPGNS